MGDHRARIKIEAEFHGIKDKIEMDINWVQEIPTSVQEFFESVYIRGLAEYHDKMAKYEAERNKEAIEKREKAELERLKNKYDTK